MKNKILKYGNNILYIIASVVVYILPLICTILSLFITSSGRYIISGYIGRADEVVYVSSMEKDKYFHSDATCKERTGYYFVEMEAESAIDAGYMPCWSCCEIKEDF